jgi:hypothetical protein
MDTQLRRNSARSRANREDSMRNVVAALLLALTATFGSGCIWSYDQFDFTGAGEAFDESHERFTRLVRWGHWEMATPFVVEDQRDAFIDAMQALGNVKFTDWEIMVMDVAEGFGTAHVEVRLEGYRQDTLETFSAVMVQDWVSEGKTKNTWHVKPDLTSISAAFAAK